MALILGRNRNSNTAATVADLVEITGNVAVTAIASNTLRIMCIISITKEDAWIRFLPAATDNSTRKGIFLKKDQEYSIPTDNVYTGEISIINAKDNKKPQFSISEY